jgi:hypothetical protein
MQQLSDAKDKGSHTSVISAIMDETLETKYRNDSSGLTRAKIIQELDPLPDKTQEEAEKILDKKGITLEQYIIKSQLLNFVKRFEREQASLVVFAAARDYKDKIDLIYEEFVKYAKEIIGEPVNPENIISQSIKPLDNEISEEEILINNQ